MKIVSVAAVLAITAGSQAAIQVVDLGTGAPPATVGGYTMVPFGDDARPNVGVNDVGVADGAPFGTLGFSQTLGHASIGAGWATWSHGYTGDVYVVPAEQIIPRGGVFAAVTLSLPAGTGAFYFYAEPDLFETFTITAVSGNTSLSIPVAGEAGANGWGFFTDDFSALTSITVSSNASFAIGEFGAARVPAPGAGALALAGLGMIARRRR